VIFNPNFYDATMARGVREDKTVDLVPGQPMVFGKERDKGLAIEGWEVKVVPADQAHVWDPGVQSPAPAFLMSTLDQNPSLPKPLGIYRSVQDNVYETGVHQQVAGAIEKKGRGKLRDLIWSGETWKV
jgi:2-oxoglutarate ferredoxin oxidoreductase subunit beta